MSFAHDSGTFSEVTFLVLLELRSLLALSEQSLECQSKYHLCQATGSDNVSSMYESVQMSCRFLDGLAHLVITIEVKDVRD
jgi:hypothetical protein